MAMKTKSCLHRVTQKPLALNCGEKAFKQNLFTHIVLCYLDPCTVNNGGCVNADCNSQSGAVTCTCKNGYKPGADDKNCVGKKYYSYTLSVII